MKKYPMNITVIRTRKCSVSFLFSDLYIFKKTLIYRSKPTRPDLDIKLIAPKLGIELIIPLNVIAPLWPKYFEAGIAIKLGPVPKNKYLGLL